MKNLHKSKFLSFIDSWNQLQKKDVEKMIKKVWVQNVPSTVRVGSFLFHKPRVNNTQSEVLIALHIKTMILWDMTL